MQKSNTVSIFTKEVSSQATLSELLTLKVLILKHAAVLTVITPLKLVGLEFLRAKESLMALSVFTPLLKKELSKFLMMSMESLTIYATLGVLIKLKSYLLPLVSLMTTRN